MKITTGWRRPSTYHAALGIKNLLGKVMAGSRESSGLQGRTLRPDVAKVIADALSSAGLDSRLPSLRNVSLPVAMPRSGGIPGTRYRQVTVAEAGTDEAGQFLDGTFGNESGTRKYKLFVPSGHLGNQAAMPLVVMLHGCTQSPADFAAGTLMNRLAEEKGFLVLYPEQAAHANGSNCWNWFRTEDQQRDRGEPSILADMVRQVTSSHGADPTRVFVAGLSAGAAMAVVLGRTYPDVFAAVGAHSGLAYGAAHDVPSAFAAMKGETLTATSGPRTGSSCRSATSSQATRTIVFHGDRDHTVDASNGAQIVTATLDAIGTSNLRPVHREQSTRGGRECTRFVYTDANGCCVAEHWIVHGAGHAWMGGDASGSYVDVHGPSATAEMVRFFLSQ